VILLYLADIIIFARRVETLKIYKMKIVKLSILFILILKTIFAYAKEPVEIIAVVSDGTYSRCNNIIDIKNKTLLVNCGQPTNVNDTSCYAVKNINTERILDFPKKVK